MKHSLVAIALAFGVVAGTGPARGQTPAEIGQTARYIAAFQNPDGGFAPGVGKASTLGATSSAIRTLGYVAGSIKDLPGAIKYVQSCHDKESGGFATTPGGKTDVPTTAVGLMAISALKLDPAPYGDAAVGYFGKNVKTFEDIRIAVAGLEAIKKGSPDLPRWIEQVEADKNPDGTFGKGPGQARATGSAAVALLRMGVKFDESREASILKVLREGQKDDGGWGEGDGPSDLGSTYRIMRGFWMLKQKPNLDKVRAYIAKHRQSDGGYAPKPGGVADPGATYTCAIVSYWSRQLDGEPAFVETAAFQPLFNGKNLDGWDGDMALWSAQDGKIVGTSPGIKHNTFLATAASYGDFYLRLSFRLTEGKGNSGVQFRSVRVDGGEMSGYQADIGEGYWGTLYDESRRNKALVQASPKALAALHKNDWNHYEIRAVGNEIRMTLNGVMSVDYKEEDPGIARDGRVGLQIHSGGPMKVEFKDLYIQPLPRPTAEGDLKAPGFHLRTVKAADGDRKYTVFVPMNYDDKTPVPAVLFLHGSGERGSDGIRPAQAGLGAAINGRPDQFPAIAVFPQARQTWNYDSDDARGALAALDDVLANYKVDRNRVSLTGLSMGGSGSWQMAAAQPDRFASLVTICGQGKPELAATVKAVPTWTLVGDQDRDATVQSIRAFTQALRDAGASPRQTEYRSVPHNSWDRAYTDPFVIDWLISAVKKKAQ
ncbi:family 16 glycoside hydrolase [Tundrisphaera sp. TA3]|uniref:family 16 glycoside hydrolase n=1 Tax=Tundrisphaera sp. TA3 TaxID=3435775 RepID=UPI003EBC1BD5